MRETARALLLVVVMAVAIVASRLSGTSADGYVLNPALMTAPPQMKAETAPRATPTPLPRNSYDRGTAPAWPR